MGKSKKKPFIDKKKASTYHLLHRSQRDVTHNDATTNDNKNKNNSMVLWPSPDNCPDTDAKVLKSDGDGVLSHWKEQMASVGLLEEDYDYEQHLKPISGTGTFVDTKGHLSNRDALSDPRARHVAVVEESNVQEVSRQLESIALTPECMDEDVAQALFGDFEEGDFEELLDDFCVTAAQEPKNHNDDAEKEEEGFDYDAHIRRLMEKAASSRKEQYEGANMHEHQWAKDDLEFFSRSRPLHARDNDDDYDDHDDSGYFDSDDNGLPETTPGVVPALNAEEELALREKFQQTLLEYDSDEVGDLDEECEHIRGSRPLEGDSQLEAALDDFLEERKDEIFMEGTRHLKNPSPQGKRTGGSSFAALVGTHMVSAAELSKHHDAFMEEEQAAAATTPVQEVLRDASEMLANPEMEPPPEEIQIDGKSYFSERTRNPWDCESILTTYSNLDNNPVTIENSSSRRRRRKKKINNNRTVAPDALPEEEEPAVQIHLSSKTGLPLGVLPSRVAQHYYEEEFNDDTVVSVNKGEARRKNETKEEKKARKAAIKQEREVARMQKKMMKEAFRDEFMKRTGEVIADDVGGKSVFRYS